MKQKIQVLLNTTGVFSHYCGYRYFIRAVELALEDPTRLQCIHKEILRHRSIRVLYDCQQRRTQHPNRPGRHDA